MSAFLSTAQVCELLGGISPQTLRRRIARGEFVEASLYAKTRRQRWRRGLVDDWLRAVEKRERPALRLAPVASA